MPIIHHQIFCLVSGEVYVAAPPASGTVEAPYIGGIPVLLATASDRMWPIGQPVCSPEECRDIKFVPQMAGKLLLKVVEESRTTSLPGSKIH